MGLYEGPYIIDSFVDEIKISYQKKAPLICHSNKILSSFHPLSYIFFAKPVASAQANKPILRCIDN